MSGGGYAIQWLQPDAIDPNKMQLMAQVYTSANAPSGAAIQLSEAAGVGTYLFSGSSNGTLYYVWERDGDIYGRSFTSNLGTIGSEVQLNITTAGFQDRPRLVQLSDGSMLVTYESATSPGTDTEGTSLLARVIPTTGNAFATGTAGADYQINTTTAGDAKQERVNRLSDNRVLEVWTSTDGGDGSGSNIRARILDSAGQPVVGQDDFILNTTTAGDQQLINILQMGDNRRLAVWHSLEDGGNDTIRGRFITATGAADGDDFVITTIPGNAISAVQVQVLADQHLAVTWSGATTSDGDGGGAMAQVFELPHLRMFTAVSDVIDFDVPTTGSQTGVNTQRLPDGRFFAFYESSGDGTSDGTDIRARLYDRDGEPLGSEFVVNQGFTAGNQTAAAALANSDGTITFVWRTPDSGNPSLSQIVARKFNIDGTPVGPDLIQITPTAMSSNGNYDFQTSSNGTIYFVWRGSTDEIMGRTFNSSWTALSGEVQLNTTGTGTSVQTAPRLAFAGSNIMVTFQSNEGATGQDVRARVIATTGNTFDTGTSAADFIVNTTTTADQTGPRVARLANGQMLEVWQSTDTGDGNGSAIRARYLNSDGTVNAGSSDFILNTTTFGNQQSPLILNLTDGRRLVLWHSFEDGSPLTDTVRGRFIHADGSRDPGDFVLTEIPMTGLPSFNARVLPNQTVVFSWVEPNGDVSGNNGIKAQIFEPLPTKTELTIEQAADRIARSETTGQLNAPWNDVIGSEHTITYAYAATQHGFAYSNGATGF